MVKQHNMKFITKKNDVYYKQNEILDKQKNFYDMKIKFMTNELDLLHFYIYYKKKQVYNKKNTFITA